MVEKISSKLFTTIFILIISVPAAAQDEDKIKLANEYVNIGETDKALILYEKLAKNKNNIQFIHSQYFNLLINTGRFDEADKYMKDVLKKFPDNINYQIDKGLVWVNSGSETKATTYFFFCFSSHLAGD